MKSNGGGAPRAAVVEAAADYRWLLDRSYPDQPAIKLVGDRYQLTGVERAMLFRGVFSERASGRRASLLVGWQALFADPESGAAASPNSGEDDRPAVKKSSGPAVTVGDSGLIVDGHNVLFTVWNYLAGRPMIAGTDGFIRDIGGTHSRLPHDERFSRLARLLCSALRGVNRTTITVLLDAPLPWSREHAAEIDRIWREEGDDDAHPRGDGAASGSSPARTAASPAPRFEVRVEEHVDARVAAAKTGWIATSDTGIIDRCSVPVVDLGGHIVRYVFGAEPLEMMPPAGGEPVTPGGGRLR